MLFEAANGFTAELKFILLFTFEKYQQFSLVGPWSAFRKAEKRPLFYQILPNRLYLFYKHLQCFRTDSIGFLRKQIQRELLRYIKVVSFTVVL